MIDDTLRTNNSKWHLSHNIRQTISTMPDERKQRLLDDIRLRRRCCNLVGQSYDTEVCQYIESLLNGRKPKNGLTGRQQK